MDPEENLATEVTESTEKNPERHLPQKAQNTQKGIRIFEPQMARMLTDKRTLGGGSVLATAHDSAESSHFYTEICLHLNNPQETLCRKDEFH